MHEVQLEVIDYHRKKDPAAHSISFFIAASRSPGVYNYGGDLDLFARLIEERDIESLKTYAEACIKCVYYHATNLDLPLITISLVQGTAMGGGFEAALAGNFLIAEERSHLGCPEIKFNLFPGMGAYTLLARKIGVHLTEKLLLEGKILPAETLHKTGAVDYIAPRGRGIEFTNRFMTKSLRVFNGITAIKKAARIHQPLSYGEFDEIVTHWTEAALRIEPKDIKMMRRLASSQSKKNKLTVEPISVRFKTRTDHSGNRKSK